MFEFFELGEVSTKIQCPFCANQLARRIASVMNVKGLTRKDDFHVFGVNSRSQRVRWLTLIRNSTNAQLSREVSLDYHGDKLNRTRPESDQKHTQR